jgi:hypothetical protein
MQLKTYNPSQPNVSIPVIFHKRIDGLSKLGSDCNYEFQATVRQQTVCKSKHEMLLKLRNLNLTNIQTKKTPPAVKCFFLSSLRCKY